MDDTITMDNQKSNESPLIPLPSGSLFINNNPKKRKQKFEELASFVSKPASALERLKAFLPTMAAANANMDAQLAKDSNCYNAEDVESLEGPVIEMNVALIPMDFSKNSDSDSEMSDVETTSSLSLSNDGNDGENYDEISGGVNKDSSNGANQDNRNSTSESLKDLDDNIDESIVVSTEKLITHKQQRKRVLIEPISAVQTVIDNSSNISTGTESQQENKIKDNFDKN